MCMLRLLSVYHPVSWQADYWGLIRRSAPVKSRELTITSSLCNCCTSSIPCMHAAAGKYYIVHVLEPLV